MTLDEFKDNLSLDDWDIIIELLLERLETYENVLDMITYKHLDKMNDSLMKKVED